MTRIYLLDIKRPFDSEICRKDFPKRFEKSGKFRFEEDRQRCFGVSVLLSSVLGLRESDLLYTKSQKPYTEAVSEKFSISHSGNYCVLAVSDSEVGADIEIKKKRRLPVSERFFLPDEISYINADSENNFYSIWTMKESVSKLTGKGLAMGFGSFSVLPLLEGRSVFAEGRTVYGMNMNIGEYSLSVCTEKPIDEITPEYIN